MKLKDDSLSLKNFSQVALHPKPDDKDAIDWMFLVDTLNFCFWQPPTSKEKWTVTYQGKAYTGYFALCAAVNRAIDEGYSITKAKYYSQITMKDLKHILRGDNSEQVPLIEERLQCLHEVGSCLLEKYGGTFEECLKEAEGSAKKLLSIITENFKCFQDEADYNGKRVCIYKRAQILIGDIWACFQGKDKGEFKDINEITMFADYRIPQVLVHFKVFQYSKELTEKLHAGKSRQK